MIILDKSLYREQELNETKYVNYVDWKSILQMIQNERISGNKCY